MNFNGLNRATFNGGVIRAIAGAALIVAVAGVSFQGVRTQYAGASAAAASVVRAKGVRVVLPAAGFVATSVASADWTILTSAEANVKAVSGLKATYTDAYSVSVSPSAASGVITHHGTGVSVSTSTATAAPSVELGYAADIVSESSASADPSVKLNGLETWTRDGFALPAAAQATVTAIGLKTAMATALLDGSSDATADAIKTHGGMSVISIVLTGTALGSIDFLEAKGFSSMTALPTLTQYAGAAISPAMALTEDSINTTQGAAEAVSTALGLTVDARLAERGELAIVGRSTADATGRLAYIGALDIASTLDLKAFATARQPGAAQTRSMMRLTAAWVVLRLGAANIAPEFTLTPRPITNPAVRAPAARVAIVPAESRAMVVPGEDRTMKVL